MPTEDVSAIRKAIRPETRMIYIETPANPTIKLSDLKACAEIAHEIGADVVAGMIVSAREEMHKRLAPMLEHLGGTMDPHQAWLVLRGLRTLAMRVEKAQEHALATTGISEISRKSETPN